MTDLITALPTSLLFFDATNFDRRVHDIYGRTDVDHQKLFAEIAHDTRLIGVHYFYSMLIQNDDRTRYAAQRRTVSRVSKIPGVVAYEGQHRKRETRCPRCKCVYHYYAEKGTDVNLTARLIHAACKKATQRLVVVSSDNDFAPAILLARAESAEVDAAFVIDPNQHEQTQLFKLDGLRRAARRYFKIDQKTLETCWETPGSA